MAITDKKTGVWGLDQIYNKINQGSIWEYSAPKELWTFGRNDDGQLGLNNKTQYSSPVQIPGTTWDKVPVGGETYTSAFIRTDGTLWICGKNEWGCLGLNQSQPSIGNISSPTQIPGTSWSEICLFNGRTGAIKTDGTLWVWGNGANNGELGLNAAAPGTRYSSPVQVPGTTWSSISMSYVSSIATRTDGTLWSWGGNVYGGLGVPSVGTAKRSSPIQIPGSTWAYAEARYYSAIATKTDGTLWCWGDNNYGSLGINGGATDRRSSPTQIPGTTWAVGRKKFSTSNGACSAIKTDGTLWSWGYNSYGSLGDNSTTQRSSPVQCPGNTWTAVTVANNSTFALKTDGTLWSWGRNDSYGNLGHNDRVNRSSPVQIPGTDWTDQMYNAFQNLAIIKQL